MPEVSDHLVKSLMRLVRQSTTVPNTSNTSAFTADTSDIGRPPPLLVVIPGRAKREPGISRFSGAQLRTVVRCYASPRNDGALLGRLIIRRSQSLLGHLSRRLRMRQRYGFCRFRVARQNLCGDCLVFGPGAFA